MTALTSAKGYSNAEGTALSSTPMKESLSNAGLECPVASTTDSCGPALSNTGLVLDSRKGITQKKHVPTRGLVCSFLSMRKETLG